MTKEQLLAIIADLELEPSAYAAFETRINTEGATDELIKEVQELLKEKVTLSELQEQLIQQALDEVAKTDAEVAKIVSDAEAELKVIEQQSLKDINAVMNEAPTPSTANPTPAI